MVGVSLLASKVKSFGDLSDKSNVSRYTNRIENTTGETIPKNEKKDALWTLLSMV